MGEGDVAAEDAEQLLGEEGCAFIGEDSEAGELVIDLEPVGDDLEVGKLGENDRIVLGRPVKRGLLGGDLCLIERGILVMIRHDAIMICHDIIMTL